MTPMTPRDIGRPLARRIGGGPMTKETTMIAPTPVFIQRFSVEGAGQFPFDMLRYDECVPETEHDSYALLQDDERRAVRLVRYGRTERGPTVGRWESFLWRVRP